MRPGAGTSNPVGAMFGRIAGAYDFLNHFLSLGIDRSWRRELAKLAEPGPGGVAIDLAAGTLDVSLALLKAEPLATVAAIDFCRPMLLRGAKKLDGQQGGILPCAGDALAIPVKSGIADRTAMAFGIRNISNRSAAFMEMLRVLKPGGLAAILEFGSGREKIWGGVYNFYLGRILPLIGRAVARDTSAYAYLARTIREFPDADALETEMRMSGFTQTGHRKLTSGIVCLHWGRKPS